MFCRVSQLSVTMPGVVMKSAIGSCTHVTNLHILKEHESE